ncbi:myo-inositol 2-dehydrogenase [Colletotrichum asianum]
MTPRRLHVGVAGLGSMGERHALIFLQQVPRARLVAVSSPNSGERDWAKSNLSSHGVGVYEEYEDMLRHESLDAVCIASATSAHAPQSKQAIMAGKHVLCEKPLSTNVEESQSVVDTAAERPDLKVVCGFSRRFDDSYRDAYHKVQQGLIGKPIIMRCQSCDVFDPTGGFVSYAEVSGGIFPDASIHDIDLAVWFFGKDSKIKSDADNAIGTLEFHDGGMVSLFASRTMSGGAEDSTEIIGTKGKLVVNQQPSINKVQLYQNGGIFHEMPQNYWERFHDAFVVQAINFTAGILDGGQPPIELQSAAEVVKIGVALQESMRTGKKILFDGLGQRMDHAQL